MRPNNLFFRLYFLSSPRYPFALSFDVCVCIHSLTLLSFFVGHENFTDKKKLRFQSSPVEIEDNKRQWDAFNASSGENKTFYSLQQFFFSLFLSQLFYNSLTRTRENYALAKKMKEKEVNGWKKCIFSQLKVVLNAEKLPIKIVFTFIESWIAWNSIIDIQVETKATKYK